MQLQHNEQISIFDFILITNRLLIIIVVVVNVNGMAVSAAVAFNAQ